MVPQAHRDVAYWHFCDTAPAPRHVRCRCKSGKHLLPARFSLGARIASAAARAADRFAFLYTTVRAHGGRLPRGLRYPLWRWRRRRCGGVAVKRPVSAPKVASTRLALNLRRERSARGFTQGQLAAKAGTERSYLSRLEHGRENPSLGLVARLAEALGVDLVELLTEPKRRKSRGKEAHAASMRAGARRGQPGVTTD